MKRSPRAQKILVLLVSSAFSASMMAGCGGGADVDTMEKAAPAGPDAKPAAPPSPEKLKNMPKASPSAGGGGAPTAGAEAPADK